MPIGPLVPGTPTTVTPDTSPTPYSSFDGPAVDGPVIADDVLAVILLALNIQKIFTTRFAAANRVVKMGNPYGTPININFTGTSGSPTVFPNGSFTITGITGNPTMQAIFWPIFVDNTASASDCHILIEYEQNGGAWTIADDLLVPQNTSRSITPIVPDIALAPGTVSVRLSGYNSSVNNANAQSMSQIGYLARYILMDAV